MTTRKQIKRLLAPLLPRNPDLVDFGDCVVLKPVRHFIRTILVDRTSSADRPSFVFTMGPTFRPMTRSTGVFWETYRLPRNEHRYWSDPDMPAAFLEGVETDLLPRLRAVESFDGMVGLHLQFWPGHPAPTDHHNLKLYSTLAAGRFDQALETCRWFESREVGYPWSGAIYGQIVGELMPLLEADDRDGVTALMHRWERDNVKRLGLDAIYEAVPFPFELDAGESEC